MLVAPGPRVDMQMPGLPVRSPQVAASMAPATSCFISRNRIWRWRAASISSTDSPPGCPTMTASAGSLNPAASTSTVVSMAESPGDFFLLSPPWQNWRRFPIARSNEDDSYIDIIHYYTIVAAARLLASAVGHMGRKRPGVTVAVLDTFHPKIRATIQAAVPADWVLRFVDEN